MRLPEFLTEHDPSSIRLKGHRIGLEHVVYYYNQGYTPEMILGQFPSLALALIHKVIAFYLENQADVDAYASRCEVEVERQRAAAPASPDLMELRRRMSQLSKPAVS
jgi:uncharacterized protein (DUF433 family)